MSLSWSILLGLVQGMTEFLPVSSSGHLVLVQSLIPGFSQPGVLFDVVLHLGTLTAVVLYYFKEILKLSRRYILLLIAGTLPAVFFGFLFDDFFESLFSNTKIVGIALLTTSCFNYLTHKAKSVKSKKIDFPGSLGIGMLQALAIIPGISRSGSTIMAGSVMGIKKFEAAKFSFLLSVPAITGAVVLQLFKFGFTDSIDMAYYLVGFMAAAISGYMAIKIVLKMLMEEKYLIFVVYTALLGTVVLFF